MSEHVQRDRNGLTEEQFLQVYDVRRFDRPSVTVDMLIFTVMNRKQDNYRKLPEKALRLLLIKRGEHPFIGQWALPGGFVAVHESIDEAAHRELRSETNVDGVYMEQLYTWGEVERDPRTRVISCAYMALVDSTALEVKAGDDAADACWFDVSLRTVQESRTLIASGYESEKRIEITLACESETLTALVQVRETVTGHTRRWTRTVIETGGIAFDHARMIEYAVERLRSKLEHTDIVFSLMPPLFTLSELQQVSEVILDKSLLAAAFRRKIADKVTETNEFTKHAGHRPSQLYRYALKYE